MLGLALTLLLAADPTPVARRPRPPRVVVTEVTDASDPLEPPGKAQPPPAAPPPAPRDRTLNRLLSEVIVSEVGGYRRFEVLSSREVKQLLGLQHERELLGCEERGCLAELAGALGADYLVTAQVGQLEHRYRLDLRLVDAGHNRIAAARGAFRPTREELADAAPGLVRELFVEAGLVESAPPVVRAEPAPRPAWAWCLVPFGGGQFAQGHPVRGALFAGSEALAFGTAGVSLGLLEHGKTSGRFLQGGTFADPAQARTQQAVFLASFWSGVALVAVGIGEAFISRASE